MGALCRYLNWFPLYTVLRVTLTQRALLYFDHPFHVTEALIHKVFTNQLAAELVSQHLEE